MLLGRRESGSGYNMVPFFQAAPATGAGGMLGDEDGMAFHRCLAAIVRDGCRGKPGSNHFVTVPCDGVYAFFMDILDLLRFQMPTHTEPGVSERLQSFINPGRFILKDSRLDSRFRGLGGCLPQFWLTVIQWLAGWGSALGSVHLSGAPKIAALLDGCGQTGHFRYNLIFR